MAEGSVVRRTVIENFSRLEHARKIFVRHTHRRVGLVVLQQNVVTRLVLLDKIVLKKQSILLRLHDDVVNVLNLADKNSCLVRDLIFVEIGAYTALQILGLADINYRAVLVKILIASWTLREVQNYIFQISQTLFILGHTTRKNY